MRISPSFDEALFAHNLTRFAGWILLRCSTLAGEYQILVAQDVLRSISKLMKIEFIPGDSFSGKKFHSLISLIRLCQETSAASPPVSQIFSQKNAAVEFDGL